MSQKRIDKDLAELKSSFWVRDLKEQDGMFVFEITSHRIKCSIQLTKDYPFEGPKIYVNDKELIYRSGWSPSLSLLDLVAYIRVYALTNPKFISSDKQTQK